MAVNVPAIAILLVSFLVMILLRFPIAYSVALSSIFCLMYQGLSLATVCQQMVKGISSYSLMAVPFFITMGMLMGSGGLSDKLVALANACVGWMRGGLGMVNVLDSYFFGGISGSAAADTASLGAILIPMMAFPPPSPSPRRSRAFWCPRATTWSSTPPPPAASRSAASSWPATFPAASWPSA